MDKTPKSCTAGNNKPITDTTTDHGPPPSTRPEQALLACFSNSLSRETVISRSVDRESLVARSSIGVVGLGYRL